MAENSESPAWLLLHAGALGDLVLSIQLAASIEEVGDAGELHVLSRTDPGDLSGLTPSVTRESLERFSAQWLYVDTDAEPAPRLRDAIAGRYVVNALGDVGSIVHKQLGKLGPARLFSFDPRPRPGLDSHVTSQWKHDLSEQSIEFGNSDPPASPRDDRSSGSYMLSILWGAFEPLGYWPLSTKTITGLAGFTEIHNSSSQALDTFQP